MTTATQACFRIAGDWLTDFARQRVLEHRWDHAVKTLECLDGISLDQIVKILKGDAKLIGDSSTDDIDLVDDDDTAYKAQLHFAFGGTWNHAGRFLRPYAKVTSWGPDDMVPAVVGKRRYRHSSLYYANDSERDFEENDILWQEVPNFPHLIVEAHSINDRDAALEDFLTIRGLEERGYLGGRSYANELDEIIEANQGKVTVDPKAKEYEEPEEPEIDIASLARETALSRMFPKALTDLEIAELGAKIREKAGDDWIEITPEIKVPRAPFENWCLWRGDGAHLAAPWEPVSPAGLKMVGDDPYHTDFWIGAGFDLAEAYDHDSELNKALTDAKHRVQKEKLGFKVAVLSGTGESPTLRAVHPKPGEACEPDQVAIIPHAGPKYQAAATTAGAVITEQGGQLAHLAIVGREQDLKIVRIKDALKIYPEGMHLVVDCSKGDVHVPFNRVDHKMKIMGMIIDVDSLEK